MISVDKSLRLYRGPVMNIKYYLLFSLLMVTAPLQGLIGKWRPDALPFALKWGAQVFALTALASTIAAMSV